jgi:PleD family two-component response regulator
MIGEVSSGTATEGRRSVSISHRDILVLDDDESTRQLLSRVQLDQDWTIHFAKDTADALLRIQAKPFDLVLTGLKSSGQKDVRTLRQIRGFTLGISHQNSCWNEVGMTTKSSRSFENLGYEFIQS